MKRRQLEARRLSESSPIAGLGTYQLTRPHRGRDVAGPQPQRLPRPQPPRVPRGSDAFGVIESEAPPRAAARQPKPAAPQPKAVATPPAEEPRTRTMLVAPRMVRAQVMAPPSRAQERRRNAWILPIGLATAVSTALIVLALYLR